MASTDATTDKADEKSGWLLKRGKLNHQFQKRWFVLKNNELKYYKNELQGDKEQGVIILEGCSVEICPEAKYKKPYAFELNSPLQSRIFVMVADNSIQLQEWMNTIRRAMLRIRRLRSKTAATEKRENRRQETAMTATNGSSVGSGGGGINSSSSSSSSGGGVDSAPLGINSSSSPSKRTGGQDFSSVANESITTPLVADDNNDEDKFDVYRQWLEETKENKKSGSTASSRSQDGSVLHRHLLDENSKHNKCCCCIL